MLNGFLYICLYMKKAIVFFFLVALVAPTIITSVLIENDTNSEILIDEESSIDSIDDLIIYKYFLKINFDIVDNSSSVFTAFLSQIYNSKTLNIIIPPPKYL